MAAAYKGIDSLVCVDAELLEYSVQSVTEGIDALVTTHISIRPTGDTARDLPTPLDSDDPAAFTRHQRIFIGGGLRGGVGLGAPGRRGMWDTGSGWLPAWDATTIGWSQAHYGTKPYRVSLARRLGMRSLSFPAHPPIVPLPTHIFIPLLTPRTHDAPTEPNCCCPTGPTPTGPTGNATTRPPFVDYPRPRHGRGHRGVIC